MPDEVADKVIATLASVKRIPADKITLDTNLQELGIDSLDVFTLLFELENATPNLARMSSQGAKRANRNYETGQSPR